MHFSNGTVAMNVIERFEQIIKRAVGSTGVAITIYSDFIEIFVS